jgi:hypothetical protein
MWSSTSTSRRRGIESEHAKIVAPAYIFDILAGRGRMVFVRELSSWGREINFGIVPSSAAALISRLNSKIIPSTEPLFSIEPSVRISLVHSNY